MLPPRDKCIDRINIYLQLCYTVIFYTTMVYVWQTFILDVTVWWATDMAISIICQSWEIGSCIKIYLQLCYSLIFYTTLVDDRQTLISHVAVWRATDTHITFLRHRSCIKIIHNCVFTRGCVALRFPFLWWFIVTARTARCNYWVKVQPLCIQ